MLIQPLHEFQRDDSVRARLPARPSEQDAGSARLPARPSEQDAGSARLPARPSEQDADFARLPTRPSEQDAGFARLPARPSLHLAIANGFPPPTYTHFVRPLLERHRVFSLPPRALWPGIGAPPCRPGTWVTLAEDLLAGLMEHAPGPVIGVGHSYGGVATLLAAVREPQRFRKLVFLDPTILPPRVMAEIADQRRRGEPARFDLVEGARRRRSRFASVDEAYAFWRSRPLFKLWPDSTVRLYAQSITRPAADGGGVELAWTGEWEAYYYESFYAETWVEAARLSPEIPLLVITGGTSTTVLPEAVEEMRRVWPWADIRTLPGHGHLFPQEMGAAAGELVADWLGQE